MLSRFVRIALAAEFLAYCSIGAWLHASRGWSVPALALAAAGTALGLRLLFVSASFAIASFAGSRPPRAERIGLTGVLRLLAREFRAVLRSNFLGVPFERWVTPADSPLEASGAMPVVMVHGYFGNRGFFGPMMQWLRTRGEGPLFAPNLPGTLATIERFAEALHAEIERIARETRQPRVVLVCHSMGGLAARRYLASHGTARVAKLVTIASPHAGTVLSALGIGRNAAQMRRGSTFLADLERDEARAAPVTATSIYSLHDNLVAPAATSRLGWARNIPLAGVGHITILQSQETFAVLLDELRDTRARRA